MHNRAPRELRALANESWSDWVASGEKGEKRTQPISGHVYEVIHVSDKYVTYVIHKKDGESEGPFKMLRSCSVL